MKSKWKKKGKDYALQITLEHLEAHRVEDLLDRLLLDPKLEAARPFARQLALLLGWKRTVELIEAGEILWHEGLQTSVIKGFKETDEPSKDEPKGE